MKNAKTRSIFRSELSKYLRIKTNLQVEYAKYGYHTVRTSVCTVAKNFSNE